MISAVDKAILGSVGILLTGATGAASAFAWIMIHSDGQRGNERPGAIVAELALATGSVKTRHRETLAWTDGEVRQALHEGDRIRTLGASHASVRYAQGLEVLLDPESQITVHGPVESKGEMLIAAIDVVDGSIRAKVESGRSIALRDAAGHEQGRVKSTAGSSEVALKAPEQADGVLGMKVIEGTKVSIEPREGGTPKLLEQGQEQRLGEDLVLPPISSPTPTPAVVAVAVATPVPPLDTSGTLPDITSEGGNVRFRAKLPAGVVAVQVRGKKATAHEDGTFEVELFDLPVGINSVDLIYRHADGSWTRQVQRIRVR